MSSERAGLRPGWANGGECGVGSAAAEGVDDLDHVAVGEDVLGVTAAGDDLAVDLHRDPASGESLRGQQIGQGAGGGEGEGGAVEPDIHGADCRPRPPACPVVQAL